MEVFARRADTAEQKCAELEGRLASLESSSSSNTSSSDAALQQYQREMLVKLRVLRGICNSRKRAQYKSRRTKAAAAVRVYKLTNMSIYTTDKIATSDASCSSSTELQEENERLRQELQKRDYRIKHLLRALDEK